MSIIATPSLSITPVTPPVGGEPTYDSGIHTSIYFEDFESYANTTALKAAYATAELRGTINLDTVIAQGGSKSCRIDWNNAGCQSLGTDGHVVLEKGLSPVTDRRYVMCSVYTKTTVNYSGVAGDDPGVGCGPGAKTIILGQADVGNGRIVYDAWKDGSEAPATYSVGPGGSCTGLSYVLGPTYGFTMESTEHSCGAGGGMRTVGHQNLDTHGCVTKSSKGYVGLLNDGNWHRHTFRVRRSSSATAGDGTVQLWIDGTLVMDYVGDDPANDAYNAVYMGTQRIAKDIQFPTTINQHIGANDQKIWYDNIRVYYVT